ncbi:MAG: pyrroline-5-carboxylate reductase [Dehalococcoidia bacterium]|nr:pyrroline-5-carboxylate reductase [Dehalococcoidia bacterium]
MRIAFIGGGTMGGAMIRCLLSKKIVTPEDIVVSDVSQSRRDSIKRECGVKVLVNNKKAVKEADLVVLAVKPQELLQVMEGITNLAPQQVILSIVAGASLDVLCRGLNHHCIVRAMPNMPVQIGEGMIVWTVTNDVSQEQKGMAQSVLGALGEELYVEDEKYLDMATALSGSGPAYVFLFIEVLIDAGVHIGLPRSIARKLVIQTVIGSSVAVREMGKHPAELRSVVTSPGGTTTEALLQLERGGFRSVLLEAVTAAYSKSKHL